MKVCERNQARLTTEVSPSPSKGLRHDCLVSSVQAGGLCHMATTLKLSLVKSGQGGTFLLGQAVSLLLCHTSRSAHPVGCCELAAAQIPERCQDMPGILQT